MEKKRRDLQNSYIDQMRDLMFHSHINKDQAQKMEKTKVLECALNYMVRNEKHKNFNKSPENDRLQQFANIMDLSGAKR